jgi:hypothetical protein
MFLVFGAVLIAIALPLGGSVAAVWCLAVSQLLLFLNEVRKRQVTGVGAFLFMSFLFFAMRPLYLVIESDYGLFWDVFKFRPSMDLICTSMWWASLAAFCFAASAQLPRRMNASLWRRRHARTLLSPVRPTVGASTVGVLIFAQLLTLPVIYVLAGSIGRDIYDSGAGAYAYDLPVPLQAIHIFAIVVILERFLRRRTPGNTIILGVSVVGFLAFTWMMRDVSSFRGFYLTGVMIAGIAVLQRLKPRVGYAWLIVPILVAQPFFKYLGEQRGLKNEEIAESDVTAEVFKDEGVLMAYWNFYQASGGDMNIFDTFIATTKAEPAYYPYALSWLYVPFHFVPRALWKDKPRKGMLIDMSFLRGAPLSPGIAGFFLLDGGYAWMLLSMVVLGYCLALLDGYVLTMRPGYLKCCFIGIAVVNAMFLTRFFLWQYFYQMLYAAVPCVILAWWLNKNKPSLRAAAYRFGRKDRALAR